MTATAAQIEAVARAIDTAYEDAFDGWSYPEAPSGEDVGAKVAQAAIEAYEATDRPIVGRCVGCGHDFSFGPCGGCGAVEEARPAATDEELIALYEDTYWSSGTHLDHESNALAAIRAVRERLTVAAAPDLPGWVDYIDAHQSYSNDTWIVRMIGYKKTRFSEQARQPGFNHASRTSVQGRGHTYANALAAALAEARKEKQDG